MDSASVFTARRLKLRDWRMKDQTSPCSAEYNVALTALAAAARLLLTAGAPAVQQSIGIS